MTELMAKLKRFLFPAPPPEPGPKRQPHGTYIIYIDGPGYGNGRDYWLLGMDRKCTGPRKIRIIADSDEDFIIQTIGLLHVTVAFDENNNVASITRVTHSFA